MDGFVESDCMAKDHPTTISVGKFTTKPRLDSVHTRLARDRPDERVSMDDVIQHLLDLAEEHRELEEELSACRERLSEYEDLSDGDFSKGKEARQPEEASIV